MGNTLITRFTCADCGNEIELSNNEMRGNPTRGKPNTSVYNTIQVLTILPCKVCIRKHIESAKKLTEFLQKYLSSI